MRLSDITPTVFPVCFAEWFGIFPHLSFTVFILKKKKHSKSRSTLRKQFHQSVYGKFRCYQCDLFAFPCTGVRVVVLEQDLIAGWSINHRLHPLQMKKTIKDKCNKVAKYDPAGVNTECSTQHFIPIVQTNTEMPVEGRAWKDGWSLCGIIKTQNKLDNSDEERSIFLKIACSSETRKEKKESKTICLMRDQSPGAESICVIIHR